MNYKCDICPAEFKTQRGLDNHKHRWFCPVCGTKLKTKNGFDRHVKNHETENKRIAAKEKQREEEARARREEFTKKIELLKERGLFSPVYKEGDKVILSTYYVSKPTHVQRFNRMVRVRYEEERRYYAREFTVMAAIDPSPERSYTINECLRNEEQYPITYITNSGVRFTTHQVFENMKDAERDAAEKQKIYDDGCREASMYR